MSGTVVSISAKEGQTLNANQTAPTILQLADLSVMTVQAQVSEADVNKLSTGMAVYFTILGGEGKRWYSHLDKIEPTPVITNNVVLYNALFDVPNDDNLLMTQMTTQVFFIVAKADNALLLPVSAVSIDKKDKTKGMVSLLGKDGKIKSQAVVLGINNRVQIAIRSGLKAGDQVLEKSLAVKPAHRANNMPRGMMH